ncbi:ABC transporter ATP-binding protein [Limosilactobacillus reuteri]|jgi:ABC-type multidrug transport system, ATPase and permease components|uniref:ABC transporter ATP-binding protein n=1 Tax=Limosilactobacillus reuteri TaxID=1598 RepID=UPI00081C19E4|nr:ABC transporter ATP-binding protein [Limosilactobacillus reuteri]MCC4330945.1 ABC transporter ATP-binding protein/permease [Limosilactobacillus reuteri]MCC4353208.1 ABC transporter ATP-binding protein/permease [Limosilactobacillus reuteri]MCH5378910.1 ABC transporter ATP-binding protein/permease [Limosilactobacillus reuteri]OCW63996.1 multidrug ABC transporter ATP-binding protein [Limosilactobacillus reuteri]OCW64813.1 multidrug ABC transporter ATP-binding protein [Limosilactobacillus reute
MLIVRRGPRVPEQPQHFWPTTKRLIAYLRPWRVGVIVSILLAVISVILSILAPKILGEATTIIYDGMLKGYAEMKAGAHLSTLPINFTRIWQIGITVILLYLFSGLFSFLQLQIMTRVSQRVVYNLRQDFEEKMRRVPIKYYDTHNNGDIMSRMVNDMDNIAGTLQQSLIQIITSLLTLVGVFILMLTISWKLTIIALVTIPLSVLVVAFVAPTSQRLFGRQQAALGKINDQVEETYAAHTIVRTFNKEQDEEEKFNKENHQYYQAAWKAQFFSSLMMPMMVFIRNLGYLVVVVVGAIQVIHGQITLGNVQAFLQYTNQFSQPIAQIANLSNTIQQTIASAERIFAVLDEPEMSDKVEDIPSFTGKDIPKVEFKDIKFSYTDEPLIQDFNLKAPRDKMVAIVGPTGAGKTTIINLLERFYDPQGGHIYLDGKDTRSMTRDALRKHIAIVLQDTWLFTGTIFENIKYGNENASDEEVYHAAKMARADAFIRELPDGYQTVLDESASNISQGQRQLLTIARAFLADPEILILDEATSSVDTRTEVLIQEAMNALQQERTSFVVAHRLSTIRKADQIVVVNHGKIIETGNHESLMNKKGFYANLYNSQFAGNN